MTVIGDALTIDCCWSSTCAIVAVDLAALDMQAGAFDHELAPGAAPTAWMKSTRDPAAARR